MQVLATTAINSVYPCTNDYFQDRTLDSFWYQLVCKTSFKLLPHMYVYFFWATGTFAGIIYISNQSISPRGRHYFPGWGDNLLPAFTNFRIFYALDSHYSDRAFTVRCFGYKIARSIMQTTQQLFEVDDRKFYE